MRFTIIGLSLTSSWGNGHATTYRGLLKELSRLGHDVLFLERDVPYYASNRDLPDPDFCRVALYGHNGDLFDRYRQDVADADVVIVGSYVQEGVEVGQWVMRTATGIKAFYDIDTPVTLAKLERGVYEYINPELIEKYDLYLSFSGGPVLEYLEEFYGSPAARALYCSVDTEHYYPETAEMLWEMGYLGTYSIDRQPTLGKLLCQTAALMPRKRFVVAGPQYPADIQWPLNVNRIEHLPPERHRSFYNSQRYTLNVTRADMIRAGYSPSVRLFEAAACGVPIISDYWDGLTSLFVEEREIFIARNSNEVQAILRDIGEEQRLAVGKDARDKIMRSHTAKSRAKELLGYIQQLRPATLIDDLDHGNR